MPVPHAPVPYHIPPTTPPSFRITPPPHIILDETDYEDDLVPCQASSSITPRSKAVSLPDSQPSLRSNDTFGESSRNTLDRFVCCASPPSTRIAVDSFHSSRGRRQRMNMNMAPPGSVAGQPGFQTAIAAYAAQMVVWLWFGTPRKSPSLPSAYPSPDSPSLLNSPNPFDTSSPSTPINHLQVSPSPHFAMFVSRLLQITMVSHSVTLLAMLYIYRLKLRNAITGQPGSENRPFVASLMLSNKYLDDNTYTNKTWSELSGIPLAELNNMEKEFLRGLKYDLRVPAEEYTLWRHLLDGFVLARQRDAYQNVQLPRPIRSLPSHSPQADARTPAPVRESPYANGWTYRARSVSPKALSPPRQSAYGYAFSSPSHAKKRSAGDAFAADAINHSAMYEQMRLPARKAVFNSMSGYPMQMRMPERMSPAGNLGRSSSLNRRVARLPGDGRRGSMGNLLPMEMGERQPRPLPMNWEGEEDWRALVAPCQENAHPQAVPPEHLMFYQLAAEAHPGQDGAPRKAILHYQNPVTYGYPAPIQQDYSQYKFPPYALGSGYDEHPMQPSQESASSQYAYPTGYPHLEPAQFANAGPPGYYYDPARYVMRSQHNGVGLGFGGSVDTGLSAGEGSNGGVAGPNEQHDPWNMGDEVAPWRLRSEWNSPMGGWQG